jgi:hypothetical protein
VMYSHEQADGASIAVTDHVRAVDAEGIHQLDGVRSHQLVGDGACDILRAAVASPLGDDNVEVLGQSADLAVKQLNGAKSAVKKQEWVAVSMPLEVGAHTVDLHVLSAPYGHTPL